MKYVHLRSQYSGKERHYLTREVETPPTRFCAVSIGYTTVTNGNDEMELLGQIAFCKRPDNFNRALSHKIIEGRMKKHGPAVRVVIPEGFTIIKVLTRMYHPDFGNMLPKNYRS